MLTDSNAIDAAIGALIIPNAVGLLTACNWPGWIKSLLAVVLSVLVALIRLVATNELSFKDFASAVSVILITSGASYQLVMKELSKKLQEVGPVK